MTAEPGRIDIHHHVMPAQIKQLLVARGLLPPVGGPPFATWDVDSALATMDLAGIEVAVASAPVPSEFLAGDEAWARRLTRVTNEALAELARTHPRRFGALAYLPLPFVDACLEEIAYAYDVLGVDGVVVGSHAGDAYLGDRAFDAVFDELDRRAAVVLTHPFNLPSCPAVPYPPFLSDFLLDTTRAAVQLIVSGTLERCPAVTVILPHGGGFLPYQAGRLPLGTGLGYGADPAKVAAALRRFRYDTAAPMSPYSTPTLLAAAGVDRILYGSDYNAIPAPAAVGFGAALTADPALDPAALRRIGRENALELLPRLAERLSAVSA